MATRMATRSLWRLGGQPGPGAARARAAASSRAAAPRLAPLSWRQRGGAAFRGVGGVSAPSAPPRVAFSPVLGSREAGRGAFGGLAGVRWNIKTPKFQWPDNLDKIFQDKGPIGDPDDPDLDRDIEIKSDEQMKAEADANIKRAEDWLAENVTPDMSEEEIQDMVRRSMELHIPPPPSWQELIMIEEEKKRMQNAGDTETSLKSQTRAKDIAMARIPKFDKFGRAYATGKRKTSVARVWVTPGTGQVIINHKLMVDYFKRMSHREEIFAPLRITGKPLEFNVWATVRGGGFSGQALAVRHGVAQCVQAFDIPTYRPILKKFKYLTFDNRQVERKKPGQRKARKKFQWVKR